MEDALKFALILTNKHQNYTDLILKSTFFSNQKELRRKQTEITSQMIDFLEELHEIKDLFFFNKKLKDQYLFLVKYYTKPIYARINQFQQKIDLLTFENKFVYHSSSQNNINNEEFSIEIIQKKLNSYYNLIQS